MMACFVCAIQGSGIPCPCGEHVVCDECLNASPRLEITCRGKTMYLEDFIDRLTPANQKALVRSMKRAPDTTLSAVAVVRKEFSEAVFERCPREKCGLIFDDHDACNVLTCEGRPDGAVPCKTVFCAVCLFYIVVMPTICCDKATTRVEDVAYCETCHASGKVHYLDAKREVYEHYTVHDLDLYDTLAVAKQRKIRAKARLKQKLLAIMNVDLIPSISPVLDLNLKLELLEENFESQIKFCKYVENLEAKYESMERDLVIYRSEYLKLKHGKKKAHIKTKMCDFFMVGVCKFGDGCRFAHGEHELNV